MEMKPILSNTDMVRALLEGRKTVTRRVVKPQPISKLAYVCMGYKHGTWGYPGKDTWKYWDDESFRLPDGLPDEERARHWVPPCHTGDILYVRETFLSYEKRHIIDGVKYAYKADATPESERARKDFGYKWRPSIHMPREAARIFLRVTDVRVERLKNITDEDLTRDFDLCQDAVKAVGRDALAGPFWDSTIKPADRAVYGWDANPYVWRIEFERCEKPEKV